MTPEELAALPEPPAAPALAALWWARQGAWDAAHERAQSTDTADAAWVHAYLHRVEGDMDNAGYWYARAGKPVPSDALDEEWRRIAVALA